MSRPPRPRLPFAVLVAAVLVARCGGSSPGGPAAGPLPTPTPTPAPAGPPNLVLIVADDMGWGDLSAYGAPEIKTPNLDRLAAEGVRLTQFVVTAALCTPSRGSFLTGLYPPKTGLTRNSLETGGLDDVYITVAEALRAQGYATHMIGKWHVGPMGPFHPMHHGFDSYFGLPEGSNTYDILRDFDLVRGPPDLDGLQQAYAQETASLLEGAKTRPFFLYLGHRSPHVPLAVPLAFLGRSAGGFYGDVVEELDWTVGELVKGLQKAGLERNTLVFFTSDNGPWLAKGKEGGSAGPFRGGKGTPWEGGLRQPAIVWWPGRIPGGRVLDEPVISLDLFPTFVALAGGQLSRDFTYYGQDIQKLLTGEQSRLPGPGIDGGRELLGYDAGNASNAVVLRSGRWKYMKPGFWNLSPALYDLVADPSESHDVSVTQPDVLRQLAARLEVLADEILQGSPQPKR